MNAAPCSCRVRMNLILSLSASAAFRARVSSPGMPKTCRTPSFSRQRTRSCATFTVGTCSLSRNRRRRGRLFFSPSRAHPARSMKSVAERLAHGREPRARRRSLRVAAAERAERLTRRLSDEPLDDHGVAPLAVEPGMPSVRADLAESDLRQKLAARLLPLEDPREKFPPAAALPLPAPRAHPR